MNKLYKEFLFKQFAMQQNNAAMKIGTDGILLGAWANVNNTSSAIDIGTGTGIIALMLAQKNSSLTIDAIESDKAACIDAQTNFLSSPWLNRLNLYNEAIQEYNPKKKYDCIISNPPFFEKSLKSVTNSRSLARHTNSLHYKDLLEFSKNNLSDNGSLSIILPVEQAFKCTTIADKYSLYLNRRCNVFPKPNKKQHRTLLELSKRNNELTENDLIIETENRHNYTHDYINLTKDFYIIFD